MVPYLRYQVPIVPDSGMVNHYIIQLLHLLSVYLSVYVSLSISRHTRHNIIHYVICIVILCARIYALAFTAFSPSLMQKNIFTVICMQKFQKLQNKMHHLNSVLCYCTSICACCSLKVERCHEHVICMASASGSAAEGSRPEPCGGSNSEETTKNCKTIESHSAVIMTGLQPSSSQT